MRYAACVVGVAVAVLTAGCAASPRRRFASGSATDNAPPVVAPQPTPAATPQPAPVPASSPCAPPPCAPPPCAPPPCASRPCAPPPCQPTCGLPCEQGLNNWRIRGVGGPTFWEGTDASHGCTRLGGDIGRTLPCSCWGVDGFYRTQTATFDRDPSGEDTGRFHFVGVKATFEKSIHGSRWFAWGGAGPQYFWTNDFLHNDSGFGVHGEAGIGYILNRNVRIRAGVEANGMSTDVGRQNPADDGDSRWLWLFAPVFGLEINF